MSIDLSEALATMQAAMRTMMQEQIKEIQAAFAEVTAKQAIQIQTLSEEIAAFRSAPSSSPKITLTPPESDRLIPLDEQVESGNGSNSANLNTIQQPSASYERLSERLPDPPMFTGKRDELPEFLYQLENKLQGNADRYPEDENKLRYALSRIGKNAAALVNPFRPTTLAALLAVLEASYGDPNRQATAQRKLQGMSQGTSSFPVYFSRFHRYAKESGWNDIAQISRLIESLNPDLRSSLIGVSLPENLEQCANMINKHYNDILRLAPGKPHYPTNQYPNHATRSTRDPNAMEIDSIKKSYAPFGSEERERRRKQNLCFKCGSSEHISPDCEVPIPKARIRTASLDRAPRRQLSRDRKPHSSEPRRPRQTRSRSSSRSSSSSNASRRSKGKSRE